MSKPISFSKSIGSFADQDLTPVEGKKPHEIFWIIGDDVINTIEATDNNIKLCEQERDKALMTAQRGIINADLFPMRKLPKQADGKTFAIGRIARNPDNSFTIERNVPLILKDFLSSELRTEDAPDGSKWVPYYVTYGRVLKPNYKQWDLLAGYLRTKQEAQLKARAFAMKKLEAKETAYPALSAKDVAKDTPKKQVVKTAPKKINQASKNSFDALTEDNDEKPIAEIEVRIKKDEPAEVHIKKTEAQPVSSGWAFIAGLSPEPSKPIQEKKEVMMKLGSSKSAPKKTAVLVLSGSQ